MAADFSIICADSGTVKAGLDIAFTIEAYPLEGFVGQVTFSVSGGPSGMMVTWPWGNVWNSGGQNLHTNLIVTFAIPLNAIPGNSSVTITGIVP